MIAALRAGFFYFAFVFGVGFVLGALRVLALVPAFGELPAVLIELPLILTAAWLICDRLIRRFAVRSGLPERMIMGIFAFMLLMVAELALSVWLFGNRMEAHLDGLTTLHGAIGLAGQMAFALFPVLQTRRRR